MTHTKIRNVFIVVCFMVGVGFLLSGIFGSYANHSARIIIGIFIMIYEAIMYQMMNSSKEKINE